MLMMHTKRTRSCLRRRHEQSFPELEYNFSPQNSQSETQSMIVFVHSDEADIFVISSLCFHMTCCWRGLLAVEKQAEPLKWTILF